MTLKWQRFLRTHKSLTMKIEIYELDFIKFKSHHQECEEASHRLGENVHKLISRSSRVLYVEERNFYRSVQGRQTAQFLRRKKKRGKKT